ncbi:DUF1464 family protein [Archaeoglobus neptunius]|uniref:DUF1464 family protein n=1 Tax=Archaeoglobus neptunius TaxID=2798580 RepID=UPI0019290D2F|nr:DUF1464 family protein [Archaeoglobus neptunius]
MITAGIDPGTGSYDVVALEDRRVTYRATIPTRVVRERPDELIAALEDSGAEVIAGLSGYGLPVKKFSELDEVDVFLMTLNFDRKKAIGLRSLVEMVRKKDVPLYTVPAVIHLPTVPSWRKMNKIDLGTADKLCSAVLAVAKISEDEEITRLNFVLAEVGEGFNAFIAIKNGRIVDGMGGTTSFPGYTSIGALDAELAYLIGEFPKSMIFSGGVKSYAKEWGLNDSETLDVLAEYVMKGLRSMEVSVNPDFYVLSGKLAGDLLRRIRDRSGKDVMLLRGFGRGKQSAQGAAVIANAIAGGEFREIVDYMRILEAKGTVLDYITSDIMEYLRRGMERF